MDAVRPHQVGSPDSIQYTPVFNGISSWQLYPGPGFWAPVAFPIGDWFRIRVAFAGGRAEAYVGHVDEPVLAMSLRGPAEPGRVGLFVGGPAIHLAGFACDDRAELRGSAPASAAASDGVVAA
jgi:hypothetical protein